MKIKLVCLLLFCCAGKGGFEISGASDILLLWSLTFKNVERFVKMIEDNNAVEVPPLYQHLFEEYKIIDSAGNFNKEKKEAFLNQINPKSSSMAL